MRLILLTCVLGLAISTTAAQVQIQSQPTVDNLSDVIVRLGSANPREGEVAFDDLMKQVKSGSQSGTLEPTNTERAMATFMAAHSGQADSLKLGLIHLLNAENAQPSFEYYPLVIDAVASLNDERAIPALVGAMATGGMAQRGLLKYGNKALEPVLNALKNGNNSQMRASALGTGVTILKKDSGTNSRGRINSLIESSLRDSDQSVRTKAIMLIECLPNRTSFSPALNVIAQTDPIKLPGRGDDGVETDGFYPVRLQARRVLRAIQNNEVCKP